jgi:hypothetical protein
MPNPNGLNPNFDGATNVKKIISATAVGATYTLTKNDSGATFVFDRAAGCVVTLPAHVAGLTFEFIVAVSATSNTNKVITAAGTELMIGDLVGIDTDTGDAAVHYPALAGDSYIAVAMNGTTTGIVGSRFTVTNLTATQWQVNGTILENGTVATPWSAS